MAKIMKDRKYSDTSDAFLCEILSKKCNEFLSSCNDPKSKHFLQISQTIKLSTNQIKKTKTIISKNKITYSNMITRSTIRQLAIQQTQQLRKKQEELLAELMRHIVQNVRLQLEDVLMNKTDVTHDKDAFMSVLEIMEEEYCLINEELLRVRKYTKKKQIRDVINFDIDSVSPYQFVQLVFGHLPNLKEFFLKFQIETFTNQQIQELRDESDLIYEIVDLDSLIEKRLKEKRQKKKNKKKKNKCKQSTGESTNQGFQMNEKSLEEKPSNVEQTKVIQFLQELRIGPERTHCGISDDWLEKMAVKYVL